MVKLLSSHCILANLELLCVLNLDAEGVKRKLARREKVLFSANVLTERLFTWILLDCQGLPKVISSTCRLLLVHLARGPHTVGHGDYYGGVRCPGEWMPSLLLLWAPPI